MWKKLSWKRKIRIVRVSAVVLLLLVWQYAIRNTVDAWSACRTLEQRLDSAQDAPQRLAELTAKIHELESGTASSVDSSGGVHEQILGLVTTYCQQHNLTLRDFPPPVYYNQQEWIVETHPVKVEGDFVSLLLLLRHLEQQKTGKVISVDFESKKDNRTNSLSLTATIYLQNIIHSRS